MIRDRRKIIGRRKKKGASLWIWPPIFFLLGGIGLYVIFKSTFQIINGRPFAFPLSSFQENENPKKVSFDFIKKIQRARFKNFSYKEHIDEFRDKNSSPYSLEIAEALLYSHEEINPRFISDKKKNGVAVTFLSSEGTVRRHSLYSPGETFYEYSLQIPKGAEIEFYYGKTNSPVGLEFKLELENRKRETTVLFSTAITHFSKMSFWEKWWAKRNGKISVFYSGRWYRQTVDLSPWDGERIKIRFITKKCEGVSWDRLSPAQVPQGFWGSPLLWGNASTQKKKENGFAFLIQSLRADELKSDFSKHIPHIRNFSLEGVDFQRTYSNAVLPSRGLDALFHSRVIHPEEEEIKKKFRRWRFRRRDSYPSFPEELRKKGYRTVLMGALDFLTPEVDPAMDWGFDEIYSFPYQGEDTSQLMNQAFEWTVRNAERGPFFLFLYLRDAPIPLSSSKYLPLKIVSGELLQKPASFLSPPLRYWFSAFYEIPSSFAKFSKWQYRAQLIYVDHFLKNYFQLLMDLNLWDKSLMTLISLRGRSFRPEPVLLTKNGRTASHVFPEPGVALREEEVRIQWALKHPRIPAGRVISEAAQLLDVSATLLKLLDTKQPDTFEGDPFDFVKNWSFPSDRSPRISIYGDRSKVLLLDGHYKYIRRSEAIRHTLSKDKPSPVQMDEEEIYDLWTDPLEQRNFVRRDRHLLSRVRRAMDEVDPDRTKINLAFWNLDKTLARGWIRSPGGDLWNVDSSVPIKRRGSTEFSFEINSSSASVSFETWPPTSSFVLKLRLGKEFVVPSEVLVSKVGLPLFEKNVDHWFDRTKFPWMEGKKIPDSDQKGPIVYLSRSSALRE